MPAYLASRAEDPAIHHIEEAEGGARTFVRAEALSEVLLYLQASGIVARDAGLYLLVLALARNAFVNEEPVLHAEYFGIDANIRPDDLASALEAGQFLAPGELNPRGWKPQPAPIPIQESPQSRISIAAFKVLHGCADMWGRAGSAASEWVDDAPQDRQR